jgi:hypothetical protein
MEGAVYDLRMLVAFILLCVAVMIMAILAPKPHGWIALGLTVVSLILAVTGWGPHFH